MSKPIEILCGVVHPWYCIVDPKKRGTEWAGKNIARNEGEDCP